MNNIHRAIFLKELKDCYPELRESLNGQNGIFYLEVDVFLRFLQQHINKGEREYTEILLARVNRYYLNGNKALHECIRNGICEDVAFEDSKKIFRSWALTYLSPPLKKERDDWVSKMGPPK